MKAVPALLVDADPVRLFKDVAAELAGAARSETMDRARDLVAATMACHGSIRAGDRVGRPEVEALLGALHEVEQSGHCPHGRPVIVELGEAEIRRRFGRE